MPITMSVITSLLHIIVMLMRELFSINSRIITC
jgi:hypothetical protein